MAGAEPWLAPSGVHGAGLGLKEDQTARIWTDIGVFSRNGDWAFSPLLGAGVFATPALELEGVVPLSITTGTGGATIVGNIFLGASYVHESENIRLKLGGGIGVPTAQTTRIDRAFALGVAAAMRGFQDGWFWLNDALPLVVTAHLETRGGPVAFVGDAAPYVIVPIGDRSRADFAFQIAPAVAVSASDEVALGLALPLFVVPTQQTGDKAQFSLEPFLRVATGSAFLSLRLTMPIDEPLGFAFDTRKFWGLHLGLGGAF
jgi:hypothetical protein